MMTLYRLFDANEALLYVGISEQAIARWDQHRVDKPWWPSVARVAIEHFPTRLAARMAEAEAIQTEDPRYNRTTERAKLMAPLGEGTGLGGQINAFLFKKSRKSIQTLDQYRFVLERVFAPWCEAVGVSDVAQADMGEFIKHLEARGETARALSVASIRTYVRVVRIFLAWCKVPVGDYEIPPEAERMRNVLSRQEIDRIEHVAANERDRLIIRVLADGGVRVSELIGLRPDDLHEDTHGHKFYIRVIGKGNREREVGLPEATFRRLKRLAGAEDFSYIFRSGRKKYGEFERLSRNSVDQVVRALAWRAQIGRRVWPHLFRHSYVTQMARKNVPVQDVMRAVGHKTPAMTMFIYNHTTADDSYDALMAALK